MKEKSNGIHPCALMGNFHGHLRVQEKPNKRHHVADHT